MASFNDTLTTVLSYFIIGLYVTMGHLIVGYVVDSFNLIFFVKDLFMLESMSFSEVAIVIALFSIIIGLLADAILPFYKKYASLLPERENMFKGLTPEARTFIHENKLFDMTSFEEFANNEDKRANARYNHQLLYLAKRFSEYFEIGSLLDKADKATELYTLFAIGSVVLGIQSLSNLVSSFTLGMPLSAQNLVFLISITFIFIVLYLVFSNRAKVSMLHSFFHASNLLNDLPYLSKK